MLAFSRLRLLTALSVWTFVISESPSSHAQELPNANERIVSRAQLNLHVIDPTGKPAVGTVCLVGGDFDPVCSDSNRFGDVTFGGIKRATYAVTFSNGGHPLSTGEVAVFDTSGNQFETIRLTGNPERSERSPFVSVAELRVPHRAKQLYDSGVKALRSSRYQEAQQSLEAALTIYPSFARARNALAVSYVEQRNFAEATRQFDTALSLDDQSGEIHLNYARLLVELEKYSDAATQFGKVLDLKFSQDSAAISYAANSLISCLISAHEPDAALLAMRKIHSDKIDHDPLLHEWLGQLLEANGQTAKAADEYTQYRSEIPDRRAEER
jgi:Tfp pilus assembly protein PilF